MAASVKVSQPFCWCDPAVLARTVKVALSRRMPCLDQLSRLPVVGGLTLRSVAISLYIFWSDGGSATPSLTEKHRPLA